MLASGEIGADGKPGARRYRSPDGRRRMPRPELVLDRPLPDRGVYPVLDTIMDSGGATTQQIAKQTGLPKHLVVEQARRLVQIGLVRFTDTGSERRWLLGQPDLRSDAA
jgi:hypothetical protein